jgi:hypothetical protein
MTTPIPRLQEMASAGQQMVLNHYNTALEGEKLERLFLESVSAAAAGANR